MEKSITDSSINNKDDESANGPSNRMSAAAVPAALHSLPRFHFDHDIDQWKTLYEACQTKLEQLRTLQAQIEDSGTASDEACEARRCWQELQNEVLEVATRTLSQEHSFVQRALEKHGAVLFQLQRRLQARGSSNRSGLQLHEHQRTQLEETTDGPAQPRVSETAAAISKATIGMLKDLIREHEELVIAVEKEREKYQEKYPDVEECRDPEALRSAEDKLRRHYSLLELQVKRLQYELSRLTQAEATETVAVSKLVEQAEAELLLIREHVEHEEQAEATLRQPQERLALASRQELFRHASRNSFVESLEDLHRRQERHRRLDGRLHSERVYREADYLDDQAEALHRLGDELIKETEDMNEMERTLEGTWRALRVERDELTAHLHPELQRLQEMQEIAKENLELETKLRKENFLFKKQLEDFQKDLLEVETDLLTGNINRKARATKNIVTQLIVLRDCIQDQNDGLRGQLVGKGLTISPNDSLASVVMGEEEFRHHITNKMKKMELRIKEDLGRRAIFKPKKFVFEPPGATKIPFRGQQNVIKVPSKAAAEWRRKTTFEMHRQEAMHRQMENLRLEILNKLMHEKERAKLRLLQYESERHALGPPGGAPRGSLGVSPSVDDVKATQELRSIMGQLGAFLQRTRKDKEGGTSTGKLSQTSEEPELQEDFGRELRTLVLQLEKLQNALEGSDAQERERKTTALERGRQLFNQLPDAEDSCFRNDHESSDISKEATSSSRSPH